MALGFHWALATSSSLLGIAHEFTVGWWLRLESSGKLSHLHVWESLSWEDSNSRGQKAGAPRYLFLSLCDFFLWSLQHGSFQVVGLFPKASRASVPRETGQSCITFSNLALEVIQHLFCHVLCVEEVKACSRVYVIFWWEKCQSICDMI